MTLVSSELVEGMNQLLQVLTTALQQLRVHRAKTRVWGYSKLYDQLSVQAATLSDFQDAVVCRLLVMDAHVDLQNVGRLRIGQTVEDILASERGLALESVQLCQRLYEIARVDVSTRVLLERLALSEDERLQACDQSLELIRQLGTPQFLATRC
ncbi:MAG: bacterioferritin [Pseudomonadota bacterium]|jgi:bacterioferritin